MVSYNVGLRQVLGIYNYILLSPLKAPTRVRAVRWALIVVRVALALFIGVYAVFNLAKPDINFLFKIRVLCSHMLFISSLAAETYWQLRATERMERCFALFDFFTKSLTSNGFSCYGLVDFILGLPIYTLVPGMSGYFELMTYNEVAAYLIPTIYNIFVLAMFVTFVEGALRYFRKLNEIVTHTDDPESCIHVHAQICELVVSFNGSFQVQLLMALVQLLVVIVTMSFQLFQNLTIGSPYKSFIQAAPFYLSHKLFELWTLCFVSTSILNESQKFSSALSSSMRLQRHPCHNRKLLLYVTMAPAAQIYAGGFIEIGTHILTSMFVTSVTYFIMIVQMY